MNQKVEEASSGMMTLFERFIYGGRWVIAPMYVGLLVTLVVYTYKFIALLVELVRHTFDINDADLLVQVLGLVDLVMIGNLVLMIMIGSYSIFVRNLHVFRKEEDRPQWLDGINSTTLKIKMGMSLIGVSSIHLLKDFISPGPVVWKHVIIHGVFILSTLAIALAERIIHGVTPPHAHPQAKLLDTPLAHEPAHP